ncbi:hypothetical protein LY90DRAFT_510502 [Neocallimastix californiae]|jgi:hypothetical protein|uniref:Uncharacterized protein n=1 Tax=Neocallimastix californiae TaxID=1754190 RepID=A0A1Y2BZ93_9FUNG|nr:hypothetical protein LY90DRAFT_510502 [Neocallimastix californiae]|eukprot:ORY40046.1 hypothetical protein LY90DRAFT_510502 [Neocallimastix californiae]
MAEEIENNLIAREEDSDYEDFDGDSTMEDMLNLFIFNRKKAEFMDWVSFLSFLVFLTVNIGCASFNLYTAITSETDVNNDMFNININNANSSSSKTDNSFIIDRPTKILYIAEFSFIMIFIIIALFHYTCLYFNPTSKASLSGAANFTRLVREFSCFTLVPLFNVNTLNGIYKSISETFEEEKRKYADRSELWDGIWGVGTKDVQKLELGIENKDENENEAQNTEEPKNVVTKEEESRIKKFKRSKFFLFFLSVLIYTGFVLSFLAVVLLAFFAFVALYIKARHVGNFITQNNGNFVYKWFNFITFITNIASLSQQSPAIKLIIYQLKVLTRKAHSNRYRRRKHYRNKKLIKNLDADKEKPGIQAPKIIIHRKKKHISLDDNDIDKINEDEIQEIDTDKLSPPLLQHKNSQLSTKSAGSV